VSREKIFPFFANARNLEILTPPWLKFQILTPGEIPMRVGTLIDYRLRVHGVPIRWRTKITDWNPPTGFADEQRRGPCRHWRHRHTFAEHNGGTVCGDRVDYAAPGGALIHDWFVRRDVEASFQYRAAALKQRFGTDGQTQ
jgi:ligand-binding SRPBCC domain-containing protein